MKFQYAQQVKVIDGFYKGLKGIVVRIEQSHNDEWDNYLIEMSGIVDTCHRSETDWVSENNLRSK